MRLISHVKAGQPRDLRDQQSCSQAPSLMWREREREREPEVALVTHITANHSMAESAEGIDGEESKRNVNAFQVAVIGGGLSGTGLTRYNFIFVKFSCVMISLYILLVFLGLFAARVLREYSIDVVVLEARDRVGGRTFTITVR